MAPRWATIRKLVSAEDACVCGKEGEAMDKECLGVGEWRWEEGNGNVSDTTHSSDMQAEWQQACRGIKVTLPS